MAAAHIKILCAAGAAAAMVLGGLAAWRGASDGVLWPLMAEEAVVLPDGRTLFVQKYEVSVAEWMRCHGAGACAFSILLAEGESAIATPATGLSYRDVAQYVDWISAQTKHGFRLPTRAEWQWMAREVLPPKPDPLFTDAALTWASSYLMEGVPLRTLRTRGSFATSREGVVDLNGSVWEWTADCFNGLAPDQCAAFYVMGEHVAVIPFMVGDPARGGCAAGAPPAHLGLRLVTDKPPQRK